MSNDVTIRRADAGDAATLAGHRVGMFRDMKQLDPSQEPVLRDATIAYLTTAMASGEYVAWIAVAPERPVRPASAKASAVRRSFSEGGEPRATRF